MLLKVPETIKNVMWEGVLEEEDKDTSSVKIKQATASPSIADELPVVSIGRPETRNLTELYEPGQLPPWIQVKLDEANFYLVYLACSFLPRRDERQFSRALFLAELLPDAQKQIPKVLDLYPLEVTQEVRHNSKITINPSLKFKEVQGSLASTDFGLEYPELQPMITATGLLEGKPSWTYQKAKGRGIQGSKPMHLLFKVPKNMHRVRAKLKLEADLEVQGNWLKRFILKNSNSDNMDRDCLVVELV